MIACKVCGGPIYRRANIAYRTDQQDRAPEETRPWLHLRQSDWVDNLHDAEPSTEGVEA